MEFLSFFIRKVFSLYSTSYGQQPSRDEETRSSHLPCLEVVKTNTTYASWLQVAYTKVYANTRTQFLCHYLSQPALLIICDFTLVKRNKKLSSHKASPLNLVQPSVQQRWSQHEVFLWDEINEGNRDRDGLILFLKFIHFVAFDLILISFCPLTLCF